jgi:hypothetical protein
MRKVPRHRIGHLIHTEVEKVQDSLHDIQDDQAITQAFLASSSGYMLDLKYNV